MASSGDVCVCQCHVITDDFDNDWMTHLKLKEMLIIFLRLDLTKKTFILTYRQNKTPSLCNDTEAYENDLLQDGAQWELSNVSPFLT